MNSLKSYHVLSMFFSCSQVKFIKVESTNLASLSLRLAAEESKSGFEHERLRCKSVIETFTLSIGQYVYINFSSTDGRSTGQMRNDKTSFQCSLSLSKALLFFLYSNVLIEKKLFVSFQGFVILVLFVCCIFVSVVVCLHSGFKYSWMFIFCSCSFFYLSLFSPFIV